MITVMRNILQSLNGRITGLSSVDSLVKDKIACAVSSDTLWSCCENNADNAMNVRMSDGNGEQRQQVWVVRCACGGRTRRGRIDRLGGCLH